jgi:hypothetical protein
MSTSHFIKYSVQYYALRYDLALKLVGEALV